MAFIKWMLIICACVAGVVSCATSEWFHEYSVRRAAEQEAKYKPRVIATSDDGCSVYRFRADGDWKYFTRCGADNVTTQRDYSVQCGKARCSRSEIIETLPVEVPK